MKFKKLCTVNGIVLFIEAYAHDEREVQKLRNVLNIVATADRKDKGVNFADLFGNLNNDR